MNRKNTAATDRLIEAVHGSYEHGDHKLFGVPYSQEPVAVLRQTNPF